MKIKEIWFLTTTTKIGLITPIQKTITVLSHTQTTTDTQTYSKCQSKHFQLYPSSLTSKKKKKVTMLSFQKDSIMSTNQYYT